MLPRLAAVLAALLAVVLPAHAQPGGEPVWIVPQANNAVIWDRHHRPLPPVKITAIAASVDIADQVAATSIEITLANSGGAVQEAVLLVPVPEGAAVRSFQLASLGDEPTAKLLPRDEARRIYDSIVSRMRDPGLLEFVGFNLIRSSVFPVPAHGTNTVRLTYETLLPADGDRVDYVLPRSEALGGPGASWSMGLDIRSKREITTVYSPSHDLVTERIDPNHVRVRVTAESVARAGSLRLSYLHRPAGGDGVSATILAYSDPEVGDGGGYFLMLAGLPARLPEEAKAIRREVTIVIDRSGSMRGEKMDQAREAALQVVEGLAPGEYFNIIDYSDSIASFADAPVEKNDGTIRRAREYLKGLAAGGGTNIKDALVEALRPAATPGALPVVLFLTDGLPTVGERSEVAIRDTAAKANGANRRVFTFGVGLDVNAPLLNAVAQGSRAAATFVLPDEDVEVKVGQVFRRLSGPILDTPRLTAVVKGRETMTRPIREVMPGVLPDLFEGDQLVVLGKYLDPSCERLVLEGNYLGEPRRFEFEFDASKASARHAFVPRLWAGRRIGVLLDEIRRAGADGAAPTSDPAMKELVDEIVRLSIKHGILTEYTAFLAVEPGTPADAAREAAVPAGAAAPAAEGRLSDATRARSGGYGVAQEQNVQTMAKSADISSLNRYLDKDMNEVRFAGVQQIGAQTVFRRGGRWVDNRLLERETEAPDQVVEYGTAEYTALAADLATQNRQGVLALADEIYLLNRGQRILVRGPMATPE